jgi:hypothetical protein
MSFISVDAPMRERCGVLAKRTFAPGKGLAAFNAA